jgi:glycosyltransferase involved in cell wall biosynthesis
MRRAAVIAPICARHDAISAAAAANHALLAAEPGLHATLLTTHDGRNLGATILRGLPDLLAAPEFRQADLLLYHFGIHHPFHDALLVGNGHARQVAVFHNVTPAEHVAPDQRPLIARSLRQAHNLVRADEVWADSPFNAADAEALGIDPARIHIVPLAVDRPAPARLAAKPPAPLRLLFVGRIVPAKGIHDLVAALARAAPHLPPWQLAIAGSTAFSDPAYLDRLHAAIAAAGLAPRIACIENPDDDALAALYCDAHILCIPSYHEGFCVPVVEGLRAGCIPLATSAGNLPAITAGLGRLVPPGDPQALAETLASLGRALAAGTPLPLDAGPLSQAEFDAQAEAHAACFAPARITALKQARLRHLLAPTQPAATPAGLTRAAQRHRRRLAPAAAPPA